MAIFFSLVLLISGIAQAENVPQWSPHDVSVSCGERTCPQGLGMVLFPEWRLDDKHFVVTVCAASLIAPNRILTANHCVKSNPEKGVFVLVGETEKNMHPISRVLFQKSGLDPVIGYGPDTAVLELGDSVSTVPALQLASINSPEPKKLAGFLLDQVGNEGLHFRFDEKICDVPEEFPFPLRVHPEAYKLLNCPSDYGNSGSPLFAPGDFEHIQAIMLDKTKMKDSVVSNTRCLHLTASGAEISGCNAPDVALLGQVTNALWEKRADKLFEQWMEHAGWPDKIQWQPLRFHVDQGDYVEMPWPTCETEAVSKSKSWQVQLPYRVIKVVVDPEKGPQLSVANSYTWRMSGLRVDNGQEVFRAIVPKPKIGPAPAEFAQFESKSYFPLRTCDGASAAH